MWRPVTINNPEGGGTIPTTDKQLKAMQVAREKKSRERRRTGVIRVKAYSAWVAADRYYWHARSRREAGEDLQLPCKPLMPELPSAFDYEAAMEASG